MTKIQGVDIAFAKSINSVRNTMRWEITYERDFTIGGLSNNYRASITPYTVDGSVGSADWVTWSGPNGTAADNTNYSTAMEFNSSGIQIAPATAAAYAVSNYWDELTNAPQIIAPLDDLVPEYSAQDTVCIQLYGDASRAFAVNTEFMGLCMGLKGVTDSNNMFACSRAIFSTSNSAETIRGDQTSGLVTNPGAQPTYFEIIIYPGLNQVRTAVGAWSGEFPTPGQPHQTSAYQSTYLACGNMTSANTYAGLVATCAKAGGGDGTAFTATAKKIRVSKLEAIESATAGVTSCV